MTQDIVLEGFSVENFRGFWERTVLVLTRVRDYRFHREPVRDGIACGCLLIGRNGSGKTDLALALFDIVGTLTDLPTASEQKDATGSLNGDSDSDEGSRSERARRPAPEVTGMTAPSPPPQSFLP